MVSTCVKCHAVVRLASLDPPRSPGDFDPRMTDFRFMNPTTGFYPYPPG
jgi:hypothetical protein